MVDVSCFQYEFVGYDSTVKGPTSLGIVLSPSYATWTDSLRLLNCHVCVVFALVLQVDNHCRWTTLYQFYAFHFAVITKGGLQGSSEVSASAHSGILASGCCLR